MSKIIYAGHGIFGALGLSKILGAKYDPKEITILKEEKSSCEIMGNLSCSYNLNTCNGSEAIDTGGFDLIISVHWRTRIREELIGSCKYGGINLHPSILPKYAGCSSLAWALAFEEKEVGWTWHRMEKGFDTGKILLSDNLDVDENDTAFSLFHKVNFSGVSQINEAMNIAKQSPDSGSNQDLSERTYFGRGFPSFDEIVS